jgi:hypothetical protein
MRNLRVLPFSLAAGSMTQKLMLTDSETTTLTLTGINFTGTNATSFSQINARGTSMAARASCSITITFKSDPTEQSNGSIVGCG